MSYYKMHLLQYEVDRKRIVKLVSNDMAMFTHSRSCMVHRHWNDLTTSCRGIIFDVSGNVICRPFNKFFNLGETPSTQTEIIKKRLKNEKWTATKKLDGSLVNVFCDKNLNWVATTKGSFTSDQAIFAYGLLQKFKDLPRNFTYCCELIAPWDRKVVNYGDKNELVLLAAIKNQWFMEEMPRNELEELANKFGISITPTINLDPMAQDLRDVIEKGDEGFVIKFGDSFRVKVKSKWYFTCHRLIGDVNRKDILQLIETGNYSSFVESLPKHIKDVADDIYSLIMVEYNMLKKEYEEIWSCVKNLRSMKERALKIKDLTNDTGIQSIVFAKMRNKPIDPVIFKVIARRIKNIDE